MSYGYCDFFASVVFDLRVSHLMHRARKQWTLMVAARMED